MIHRKRPRSTVSSVTRATVTTQVTTRPNLLSKQSVKKSKAFQKGVNRETNKLLRPPLHEGNSDFELISSDEDDVLSVNSWTSDKSESYEEKKEISWNEDARDKSIQLISLHAADLEPSCDEGEDTENMNDEEEIDNFSIRSISSDLSCPPLSPRPLSVHFFPPSPRSSSPIHLRHLIDQYIPNSGDDNGEELETEKIEKRVEEKREVIKSSTEQEREWSVKREDTLSWEEYYDFLYKINAKETKGNKKMEDEGEDDYRLEDELAMMNEAVREEQLESSRIIREISEERADYEWNKKDERVNEWIRDQEYVMQLYMEKTAKEVKEAEEKRVVEEAENVYREWEKKTFNDKKKEKKNRRKRSRYSGAQKRIAVKMNEKKENKLKRQRKKSDSTTDESCDENTNKEEVWKPILPSAFESRFLCKPPVSHEERHCRTVIRGIRYSCVEEDRLLVRILAATAELEDDVCFCREVSPIGTSYEPLVILTKDENQAKLLRSAFVCRRFRRAVNKGILPFILSKGAKATPELNTSLSSEDERREDTYSSSTDAPLSPKEKSKKKKKSGAPSRCDSYEKWSSAICSALIPKCKNLPPK